MINDHLYEGRFMPTNADGKRISRIIYAQTREQGEKSSLCCSWKDRHEIKGEKESAIRQPACKQKRATTAVATQKWCCSSQRAMSMRLNGFFNQC